MKTSFLAVLSVVCVATFVVPASAGPVGVQRNLSPDERAIAVGQLQATKDQVSRQLPEPPKGPALARYMDKRARLQDLINRIQSGQPVSPDEIDQALQATYW
jgi:hypothetical protein